jgi:hypothetical protein
VAHARNRQLLADDTDAGQVGDVVFGDAGQLEAGLAARSWLSLAAWRSARLSTSVKQQARWGVSWRRLRRMLGVLDVVMEPPFD